MAVALENVLLPVYFPIQIPVIKGADRPFDGFWNDEKLFFGLDNFGNSAHIYQVGTSPTSDKVPASLHLLEIVRRKPGQLTLVQVAPLTNLATALLVDPDFTKDVKEIFIMGGNYKGTFASSLVSTE